MTQSKTSSLVEALSNVVIGLFVDVFANWIIFPLFGWELPFWVNVLVATIYMVIGLLRSYIIRRAFNFWG